MENYTIAYLHMPDPALPDDSRDANAHIILYIIRSITDFDDAMRTAGWAGSDCVENLIVNAMIKGFLLGKIVKAPEHPWPGSGSQDRGNFFALGFISSEATDVAVVVKEQTLRMQPCPDPACPCTVRWVGP